MKLNRIVEKVTQDIESRSTASRTDYLKKISIAKERGVARAHLSCSNLAHAYASASRPDKVSLVAERAPNLAIISAYNDLLSAHQPFKDFPDLIKQAAHEQGATAQFAGGVPAMCDGITQGQPGMELSLFSRDVIAMAAAVALSHNCFDASVYLGVCDKIIPGLVIAAATFGHVPAVFLPAGPMTSGLSNDKKSEARKRYAQGKIDRKQLLAFEMQAYHAAGTCTFYGTANSNQMLMEVMGLHLPGASFINPNTPLRKALTLAATQRALQITNLGDDYIPTAQILSVKTFVNAIVGLHATGGSTNLVLHLIAMAKAAGILITTQDFADLSAVTPLLARVYPNGKADVNHFHAAGGLRFIISQLLSAGLLHDDVMTVMGSGLQNYLKEPTLNTAGDLLFCDGSQKSLDETILRPHCKPFQKSAGLVKLTGEIGEAVIKTSALERQYHVIEAPAIVFHDQKSIKTAFGAGKLARDFICVVRFQGPCANGMPELHGLTPILSIIQDLGFKVALLTDGRMSGASGKVPAAIHVTPEAAVGGAIAKIRDGDIINIDAIKGTIEIKSAVDWQERDAVKIDMSNNESGLGRELFHVFRQSIGTASEGASVFFNQKN